MVHMIAIYINVCVTVPITLHILVVGRARHFFSDSYESVCNFCILDLQGNVSLLKLMFLVIITYLYGHFLKFKSVSLGP